MSLYLQESALDAQEGEIWRGRGVGGVAQQHLEEHRAQRPQVGLHAAGLVAHGAGR